MCLSIHEETTLVGRLLVLPFFATLVATRGAVRP
jgi:hypothetical protein